MSKEYFPDKLDTLEKYKDAVTEALEDAVSDNDDTAAEMLSHILAMMEEENL